MRSRKVRIKPPVVVGLVGGIASGKSFVSSLLRQLGAEHINADEIGHSVLGSVDVKRSLVDLWGPAVLDGQDQIDRKQISKMVFGTSAEAIQNRRLLEKLVHPLIHEQVRQRIAAARARPDPPVALVLDAPLLIEAGWAEECDIILYIEAPIQLRKARAQKRGWSEAEFMARQQSQLDLDTKRQAATLIIDNSRDDVLHVKEQVEVVWKGIEQSVSESLTKPRE